MPAGVQCYTLCIRLTVICMKLVFHLFDLVQLLFITFVNQVLKYTLVIECLSLLFIIIFSASGNHSNNTRDTKDKFLSWFYFIRRTTRPGYAGTSTNIEMVLNTHKNPFLYKSSHQHKYLPNFPTKKIQESKISNLKKSFDNHPRHLKSRVPPLESLSYFGHYKHFSHDDLRNLLFCFFLLLL